MKADWHDVIQRHMAGLTTDEESALLQQALKDDDALARLYLHYMNLDVALDSLAVASDTIRDLVMSQSSEFPQRRSGWRAWRPFAAVAAAVVLTLVIQHFATQTNPTDANADLRVSIATLLLADDCQWEGAKQYAEGQRLAAQTLRLKHGLAVLRFDSGAAAILTGTTELSLQSRGSALLHNGEIVVRAPDEAAGFILHTPASEVVDLGTEFAVKVGRSGSTEIHVLEGEVAYRKPNAGGGTDRETAGPLLTAGQAVRYDRADAAAPHPTKLDAPRFDELIRGAKLGPREDLLLAEEGFFYPVGSLPLKDAEGGTGWAGPWQIGYQMKLAPGETGNLDIAMGKLNQHWPMDGGRWTALKANPGFASRTRPLAQPLRLDMDGVYYVSLMVRWDTAGPSSAPGDSKPSVRLALRSAEKFFGDHVLFWLPASHKPQIEFRDGEVFASRLATAPGKTQLWIGKIVARQKGEDEVSFRIYEEGDPFDLMEPAQWSVQTRGIRSDARLDLVGLTVVGQDTCWFDELRIGTNWRAVVPPQAFAKAKK